MRSLMLFECLLLVTAADPVPPGIVVTPGIATPMPPVGAPAVLDIGKFCWLDYPSHAGVVTWDDSPKGLLSLPPEGDAVLWAGKLKGTTAPAWHKVPAGQYPVVGGGEALKADEFAFSDVPDLTGKKFGGTPQGSAKAGWYAGPTKTAVPCLGVAKGTVTVSAWGVVDGRPKKLAELVIDVGPRGPPDVEPDVKPVGSRKLAAYIVYESSDKTAKWAAFFGSKELADRWTAKGHTPPVLADQNVIDGKTKQPPVKLAPYLNRAKGKALPQLYLIDATTGDVAYEGPAPESPAELLKLLDRVGG